MTLENVKTILKKLQEVSIDEQQWEDADFFTVMLDTIEQIEKGELK